MLRLDNMTHNERVGWIADWMRCWAPEIQRRIERGDEQFARVRDRYNEMVRRPDDAIAVADAQAAIDDVRPILDNMHPPPRDLGLGGIIHIR